ncbi:glycosyltransferase 87 family protein [Corynebacterium variabile]|uniref:glycosyltransferase 87 family protein n=1 Tax=Corynebacterium variabile TaxID=1727 RepID=UPI0028F13568|nr:glycosyltransferase 87 family protein [Corynebacterium variabile]
MTAPTASPTTTADTPRTASRPLVRGLFAVVTIVGLVCLVWQLDGVFSHVRENYLLDVGVFVDAGQAILDGNALYGDDFPSRSGFAFIYPPLAAVLFVPLTWMGEETMEMVWTLASLAAAWAVLTMAVHRITVLAGVSTLWRRLAPLTGLAALGFALLIEPLQVHLMYGQINVFLVLLVAADLLGYTPKWLRGAGVGIAAGIKITPAAYALVFLVTRKWGDLARSFVAFLVTAGLGWIFRASDSTFFWTEEFFNGERGGGPGYAANQALTGILTRAGMDGDTAQTLMIPGLLVIAVISGWAVWRLSAAGRPVSVLLTLVLAVSISAPIAVTHHWTGIIVAIVLLAAQLFALVTGRRDGWDWPTLTGTLLLVVANLSFGRLSDEDYQTSANHHYQVFPENGPWSFSDIGIVDFLYGNIQGISGIICLALLCFAAWRARPAEDAGPAEVKEPHTTDA